jgi:antitoxin MazE
MKIKIIQIENSKGIRLPKRPIAQYHLTETITIEELSGGIFIKNSGDEKLSWENTYRAMAQSDEDWSDWDTLDLDITDEN